MNIYTTDRDLVFRPVYLPPSTPGSGSIVNNDATIKPVIGTSVIPEVKPAIGTSINYPLKYPLVNVGMPVIQPVTLGGFLLEGKPNVNTGVMAGNVPQENIPSKTTAETGIKSVTGAPSFNTDVPMSTILSKANASDISQVKFAPLRITVWSKAKNGPITNSVLLGGIQDMMLTKGRWVITFDIASAFSMALPNPIPITWNNKKV